MSSDTVRFPDGTEPHTAAADDPVWPFAAALSSAVSVDDVATSLAELGAATAGAVFANLALFSPSDGRVRVTHASVLDPGLARRWAAFDLDEDTPLGTAIIHGEPVLLDCLDTIRSRYPALEDDTVRAGLVATASLPIRSATGEIVGAAGFGWDEPQPFDDDQTERLHLVVELAAGALDRALDLERERDEVGALDRTRAALLHDVFLPTTLPASADLEVAAAFLPASGAAMGGDWYDVFPVDGGTCLVVGDVAGHGLSCVAAVGLLRNAIRAFADEDPSPARTLTRLNRLVCRLEPEVSATAIVAVWNPVDGSLLRSTAGHPPALCCRPGEVDFLTPPAHGLLLGAERTWVYQEEPVYLAADTTLLYYSDGLIESRTASLDDGMAELRAFVSTLSDLSPQPLCDAVLDWRTNGPARDDDICILAVRVANAVAS